MEILKRSLCIWLLFLKKKKNSIESEIYTFKLSNDVIFKEQNIKSDTV